MFTAAKKTVGLRRQEAEIKALLRRDELFAAAPELFILDAKKSDAGALAARLSLDGEKDKAQEQLSLMRDIAQRRLLLLSQHGYTEKDFSPKYSCNICSDSGFNNSEVCQCVLEEMRRLRRSEVNTKSPLMLSRFENFRLDIYPEQMEGISVSPQHSMQQILSGCKTYASDFGVNSGSLFLFGGAGLGKTHLALSVASEVLEKGFDVIYVSAQNAFSTISSERYSQNGTGLFSSMLEADLLVLDDLGTEFIDAYVLSKLYELVNTRMRKPSIYTTNICRQDSLHQRYTEKIASRLLGECQLMRFWGCDFRLAKH